MDLSKLPKLSGKDAQEAPPPLADAPMATPAIEPYSPPYRHAEPVPQPEQFFASPGGIFISIIIALIFLFLGQNFGKWAIASARGQPFNTGVNWTAGPKNGQAVDYWELQGDPAWTDCGMFLFGLSAAVDAVAMGIVLRSSNRGLTRGVLMFGMAMTLIATIVNLLVVFKLFAAGVLPLFSLLAFVAGVWILFEQLPILFPRKTGSPAR